ncbi:Uncharacterised protein [uncultured archaeon]|nr:Uncharacterised protein [uncultured archaeon]
MDVKEQDYAYSRGFLEEWLKSSPTQVTENLNILFEGLELYRDGYNDLLKKYNELTALSATYLSLIQQQKAIIDQQLIESQREFHQREDETNVGRTE